MSKHGKRAMSSSMKMPKGMPKMKMVSTKKMVKMMKGHK